MKTHGTRSPAHPALNPGLSPTQSPAPMPIPAFAPLLGLSLHPTAPLIVSTGGRHRGFRPCDDAVEGADCDVVVFPDTLFDLDGSQAGRLEAAVEAAGGAAIRVATEWVPAGNDAVPRWILPVRIVVCPRLLLPELELRCPLRLLLPPSSQRQYIYDPRPALMKKGLAPGKLYTVAT